MGTEEIQFLSSLTPFLEEREQTIIKGILSLMEGLNDPKVREALQILNPDYFRSEILRLEANRRNNFLSVIILIALLIVVFKFLLSWW